MNFCQQAVLGDVGAFVNRLPKTTAYLVKNVQVKLQKAQRCLFCPSSR